MKTICPKCESELTEVIGGSIDPATHSILPFNGIGCKDCKLVWDLGREMVLELDKAIKGGQEELCNLPIPYPSDGQHFFHWVGYCEQQKPCKIKFHSEHSNGINI